MKQRSAVMAFAFLLLTGSVASASSTALASAPVLPAGEDAAFMTPADGSSGCPASELSFLTPEPIDQALGPCGTCSSPNCRGGSIGQGCGFSGGQWYTCQFPYSQYCTGGKPKCYCWTGDLP